MRVGRFGPVRDDGSLAVLPVLACGCVAIFFR